MKNKIFLNLINKEQKYIEKIFNLKKKLEEYDQKIKKLKKYNFFINFDHFPKFENLFKEIENIEKKLEFNSIKNLENEILEEEKSLNNLILTNFEKKNKLNLKNNSFSNINYNLININLDLNDSISLTENQIIEITNKINKIKKNYELNKLKINLNKKIIK